MKKICWLLLMAVTVTVAFATQAQPPPERPARGPRSERAGPGMEEEQRPPASPVRQWMRELQERDPETFRQLQALRRDHPAAFREQAMRLAAEQMMDRLRENRPNIYNAIRELPEDDRRWLMERLWRQGISPPAPRPGKPAGADEAPRLQKLVREYHQAPTPEARAGLRRQLEQQLSEQYDRRVQERRRQLTEAEENLENMRQWLERGERGKQTFMDEKLSAWLDAPPGATPSE